MAVDELTVNYGPYEPYEPPQNGGLFCEFVGYSAYDRFFDFDDTESWIHITNEHLRNRLSRKCVCWFCDDIIFECQNEWNREENFGNWMWHIREHILSDGYKANNMRPAHFLYQHLRKSRLVNDEVFVSVMRWSEATRPLSTIPFSFDPLEWSRNSRDRIATSLALEDRDRRRQSRKKEQDNEITDAQTASLNSRSISRRAGSWKEETTELPS
ncbi:hypothetical protein F5Y16DRAFT_382064 [Xylariaceae sp. FL0255]|nr:hypothetical protein F5Y16DRAFT_382064 [Xylariaceae sp. FL0255]